MATTAKNSGINKQLLDAFSKAEPKNPSLTTQDKTYLRGLRRQGFTQEEITSIANKSGFQVPADLFSQKTKKKTT